MLRWLTSVVLGLNLLAAFEVIFRWGAEQWAAFGTLAAVVVALMGAAQARADARREIKSNALSHRQDVLRLQRQHKESLRQAARLHREELDRTEARHLQVLSREHVRDQISSAREVVAAVGDLMLPLIALCQALEDLGRLIVSHPSAELSEEVDSCVRATQAWTVSLLAFNAKLVSAEMVTTNQAVFDILRQIKAAQSSLSREIESQQYQILAQKTRGQVDAVRAAYTQLANLNEPLREVVAHNLRPIFLATTPGTSSR